jgi:ABC-2 type transport system ATP-binding protein
MFGLGEDVTRRRVAELLTALELADTSKTLAEYSTGMHKRVALAAAVILMKRWLRRFVEHGRTVSITSHVLDTVERLCTDVAGRYLGAG